MSGSAEQTQRPVEIRATHHYAFRSGQWAQLLMTVDVGPRPCYVVEFTDGMTDWWPVDDPVAGYEIRNG